MFQANYHTHTKRCGHARGEDSDYVKEAIGHGYRFLGFSDHAMLPGYSEPRKRGEYALFDGYVSSIRSLAETYADQITITLGMEAESFPQYFPYYQELLSNHVIDYLILGNHSAMDEKKHIYARFEKITSASQLYLYRDLAVKALKTHMFSIFAHPDYYLASIGHFDSDCKKVAKSLIEAAISYDVPLEVNLAGIRNGKHLIGETQRWIYPTDFFFRLVSHYHAKCIFGMDAHAPEQLNNTSAEFQAVEFANRHNLEMVDTLPNIEQH